MRGRRPAPSTAPWTCPGLSSWGRSRGPTVGKWCAVFITDVRYGDRLTQIRREVFGDNFPGSALITITALAVPDAKIEIQVICCDWRQVKFPKRAGGRSIEDFPATCRSPPCAAVGVCQVTVRI